MSVTRLLESWVKNNSIGFLVLPFEVVDRPVVLEWTQKYDLIGPNKFHFFVRQEKQEVHLVQTQCVETTKRSVCVRVCVCVCWKGGKPIIDVCGCLFGNFFWPVSNAPEQGTDLWMVGRSTTLIGSNISYKIWPYTPAAVHHAMQWFFSKVVTHLGVTCQWDCQWEGDICRGVTSMGRNTLGHNTSCDGVDNRPKVSWGLNHGLLQNNFTPFPKATKA